MLEIERQELAGIPCVTLRDRRVDDAPVLIHYHGWTGNKGAIETPDKSLVQLASAGFLVVAPDCYEHGERMTEAWFRAMFNGWAFICEAMDNTRQEAGALFEAVMTLPYASARNPQVTGGSMGGVIAQMVFAENSAFVSLISVVGRSSFTRPMNGADRPKPAPGATTGALNMPPSPIPSASPIDRSCSSMAPSIPIARPPPMRKLCG